MPDRVAVVTGAAKGIGAAIAEVLAGAGYAVAAVDQDPAVERVAEALRERGMTALGFQADVSAEGAVAGIRRSIRKRLGRASRLVNNAAVFPRVEARRVPLSVWERVISVNLNGAFICARAFVDDMMDGGSGSIVNIASNRALIGAVGGTHYAASKAGVIGLTRSLALEWAPAIRVNVVVPGFIDTDQLRAGSSDDELEQRAKELPMKRIGLPHDVARAVAFLLSDDAGFITGQSLCVNGGSVMH